MSRDDCMIIAGDFGGVWYGDERDDEKLDWLESRPLPDFVGTTNTTTPWKENLSRFPHSVSLLCAALQEVAVWLDPVDELLYLLTVAGWSYQAHSSLCDPAGTWAGFQSVRETLLYNGRGQQPRHPGRHPGTGRRRESRTPAGCLMYQSFGNQSS